MRYSQKGEQPQFGGGIGATASVLSFNDGTVAVVDWGVAIENNPDVNIVHPPAGNYLRGTKVRWLFVTHAHQDHGGAVPRFVSEHHELEAIFMSPKTYELLGIMLPDSLKIATQEAHRGGKETADLIFTEDDLISFLSSPKLRFLGEDEWVEFPDGWRIAMPPAGHIVGARSVCLDPPANINDRPVYYTGDRSSVNQRTVKGVILPDGESFNKFFSKSGLVIITEGTNGNRDQARSRTAIENDILSYAREVRNRGGWALFAPSFSVNRCAELVLILTSAGFRVHVDGLGRKTCEVEIPHNRLEELRKSELLIFLESDKEKAHQHRQSLATGNDPCGDEFAVIISPSAMMDKGFAVQYAEYVLRDRKNGLLLPGHLFPGSTAWELWNKVHRGGNIKLRKWSPRGTREVNVPVQCEVRHFDLSAHDYRNGLVNMVQKANPAHVIVHHASPEAYEGLRSALTTLGYDVRWGRHGEDIEL